MSSRENVIKKYTSGSYVSPDYLPGTAAPITSAAAASSFFGASTASAAPGVLPGLTKFATMPSFSSSSTSWIPSFGVSNLSSIYGSYGSYGESGVKPASSYFMQVLFYLFLYTFILFIISIFIHFTITPVFSFSPGGPGFITIPGTGNDLVVWNTSGQPDPAIAVPADTDINATYPFINNFSLCLDIYITNMTSANISTNRLIMYKTGKFTTTVPAAPPSGTAMIDYMASTVNASMIMYLANDTNDLVVTFFSTDSAGQPVQYSCSPIKNIPLYTPFRISLVVEKSSFAVYLNAKQVFQKIIPGTTGLTLNPRDTTGNAQRFYFAPSWASLPTQTVFVQNLHIWPQVISYADVQAAQPSLASVTNFGAKKAT
jgi:hypothetical protein